MPDLGNIYMQKRMGGGLFSSMMIVVFIVVQATLISIFTDTVVVFTLGDACHPTCHL